MRKNGFTLIELLAVIVILAIIALIATPIILGIINDARRESQERSIELYASAVKNGIALSQLSTGKAVKPGTYTSNTLPFEVKYDGDVDCTTIDIYKDGTIYVEGCTVNDETVEYAYGKNKGTGKPCTLEDKDGDGEASLSDVVTCGTESFYVMTNEDNEITMLAMYNLDVGNVRTRDENWHWSDLTPIENPTNKQSELAKGWVSDEGYEWYEAIHYGLVVFYNEEYSYWDPNGELSFEENYPQWVYDERSNLYQYINEYERILKDEMKVNSAKTSLISYEQLIDLGCDSEMWTCGPDWGYGALENPSPEWVYSTSYWTGSADDTDFVWDVYSDGGFDRNFYGADDGFGVRPVVTISTSEI